MPRRRRGSPPPNLWDSLYPTLDLHGDTAAEAQRRAERWLREQHALGEPVVRVITGRGLHSAGPAVLPSAVEDLLRGLRHTIVRDFDREPGGGVVRIRLLRGGPDPAPPKQSDENTVSIGSPRDRQLERRAEEALAELGITPTPELLRAEMRRLRSEAEE